MRILPALFALILLGSTTTSAAHWPSNWLGPADDRYKVLDIGVYYYGAVLEDIPSEDGSASLPLEPAAGLAQLQALPELSLAARQAEWERVRGELEEDRRFYWRNSRFNVVLDHKWHVDLEPRLHSTIAAADAPYYSPVEVEPFASARRTYDGIVVLYVLYRWDAASTSLKRVRGGGGFTWGASRAEGKCGVSWWAAPPADHVCGSDWLECHEFGHSLDSLLHESGHPEHWFNHLALSEANAGPFGEHFDAMGYVLKRTKERDWLDIGWGSVRGFADADGDDVPDADAWLQARGLEVDPDDCRADADGDGLSDYAELVRPNGNRMGHGEMLHPALGGLNPHRADSDGDGTADGRDEHPALPLRGNVRELTPNAGWLEPNGTKEVETFELARPALLEIPAANEAPGLMLQLGYTLDKSLMLKVHWGSASDAFDSEVRLNFDFDNDGWFKGTDNYRLLLNGSGLVEVIRADADSHSEWPREAKDSVDKPLIFCVPLNNYDPGAMGYGNTLVLLLDREPFPELAAKPGEEFGFNAGVRFAGQGRFAMVAEPNAFAVLELR